MNSKDGPCYRFWCDTTPQGKFMLSIAFSQSKYYVDNLSENIKRGHRNKMKDIYATGNFTLRQLHDKFNALGLSRKNGSKMLKWIYENTYYRLFVYLPRTRAKAS